MGHIAIRLFDGLEIDVDGIRVDDTSFERRHASLLVKLLALNGGRLHREKAIDALWPDATLDEAAPRLHQSASYARRALGDKNSVVLRDEAVVLWPEENVTIDVEQFELAADRARSGSLAEAGEAADLYTGDLLPAEPYEDWVGPRRDQLRLRFLDTLRAAERWESLLEHEPADEEAHLILMQRYVDDGQRLATLRQFERLERALNEELGVSPSKEALAMRQTVLDTVEESTDLVDRSAERALMQRSLDDAVGGTGSLLLLTGEAGIGKTSLAEWLVGRAEQLGFVVGRGVAASVDGLWPYAPVLEAIEDVLHRAPELLEELPESYCDELMRVRGAAASPHDRPADDEGHQRLFVAVDALVRLTAADRGLVLFIDDLQAADDASLSLLHYLGRQANRNRLLVVCTARPGVESDGIAAIRSLVGRHGAREVPIEPFGREHAVELVQRVAGESPTDEVIDAIVELAGGTPFYVEEMTRTLSNSTVEDLPRQLATIVSASYSELRPELRESLTRVAVAGNRLDTDQFIALSGADESTAFDLLDEALAAGILEPAAGGYRFRHEITRDSMLDGLPPHRRRVIHRDAAERFEAMGAPAAQIAHHLIEAGDEAAAASWALQAARAAEAVGALSDARAIIDPVVDSAEGETRLGLLAVRADVLTGMADPGAVPAYQQALAETEGPFRRLLRAKLARAALMGGAIDIAQSALDGLEPDGGPFDGVVLHAQGMLAYFGGDLDTAGACADQARQLALADGAPAALLDVLTLQGMVAHNRGEWFDRMRVELTTTADSKELAATIFDCHL